MARTNISGVPGGTRTRTITLSDITAHNNVPNSPVMTLNTHIIKVVNMKPVITINDTDRL